MSQIIFYLSYLYLPLLVWMLIDCYRREPDRGIWILVMLALPPLGLIAYFLARYLPRTRGNGFQKLLGRFQTGDLRRLQIAAAQIGNAYHWIQYGDRLREVGRWEPAEQAYRKALEKEPQQLAALWGLSLCLTKMKRYAEALPLVEQILTLDPEYKFGDVSLARGRLLCLQENWPAATEHLERHIRRWRQPEGMYLLAEARQRAGDLAQAESLLNELIMDIDASPPAIARKQAVWKRKATRLRRAR